MNELMKKAAEISDKKAKAREDMRIINSAKIVLDEMRKKHEDLLGYISFINDDESRRRIQKNDSLYEYEYDTIKDALDKEATEAYLRFMRSGEELEDLLADSQF